MSHEGYLKAHVVEVVGFDSGEEALKPLEGIVCAEGFSQSPVCGAGVTALTVAADPEETVWSPISLLASCSKFQRRLTRLCRASTCAPQDS